NIWQHVPVPHKTQTGGQGVFGTPWAPPCCRDADWQAFERDRIAVDPHDPRGIYADIVEGLGKSTDGGQTWTIVLPFRMRDGSRAPVLQIAVSAADSQIIYETNGKRRLSDDLYELHRSRDGGATWETIRTESFPSGFWIYPLYPYPTDPNGLSAWDQ